jgi:hypothetical protein
MAERKKVETKKCPMCAETIDAADTHCRYCGAQFIITRQGYCQNCHRMTEADNAGKCRLCGSPLVDLKLVSTVTEPAKPQVAPIPPAAAASGPTRSNVVLPYVIATLHVAVALHFVSMIPNIISNYSGMITAGFHLNQYQLFGIINICSGVILLPAAAVFLYLRKKTGFFITVVYAAIAFSYLLIWIVNIWTPQLYLRILITNIIYYSYPIITAICMRLRYQKDFK